MPKPDLDALARRFVGALYADTDGRPLQWRSIDMIGARARLGGDRDKAVARALALGLVEVQDGHSVQLTDAGRRVAG